jgi:hypothetical protein
LYEEYSTPLVTKLDEVHYDAHPFRLLFDVTVGLPLAIFFTPMSIILDNKILLDSSDWNIYTSDYMLGCTQKKLLNPILDSDKKTKTGKYEWRNSSKTHKFLVSGFGKDYVFSQEQIDLSSVILNTDIDKNINIEITCMDCDLDNQAEQAIYNLKKSVRISADFREIKVSLLAQDKARKMEHAKKDKETLGVPLEEFKEQCQQLGFKDKSTDFGNCVLQLNNSK